MDEVHVHVVPVAVPVAAGVFHGIDVVGREKGAFGEQPPPPPPPQLPTLGTTRNSRLAEGAIKALDEHTIVATSSKQMVVFIVLVLVL